MDPAACKLTEQRWLRRSCPSLLNMFFWLRFGMTAISIIAANTRLRCTSELFLASSTRQETPFSCAANERGAKGTAIKEKRKAKRGALSDPSTRLIGCCPHRSNQTIFALEGRWHALLTRFLRLFSFCRISHQPSAIAGSQIEGRCPFPSAPAFSPSVKLYFDVDCCLSAVFQSLQMKRSRPCLG
jgi:hypothetical protein